MAERELETALKLRPSEGGIWHAFADPNYESGNGMFGGWTAAVPLRAVFESADGGAKPCVISVNFINKIEPGTQLSIRTRRLGGGRPVSHWEAALMSEDQNTLLAFASVILAERRDSDGNIDVVMPGRRRTSPASVITTFSARHSAHAAFSQRLRSTYGCGAAKARSSHHRFRWLGIARTRGAGCHWPAPPG
jgi:hypothetical protein